MGSMIDQCIQNSTANPRLRRLFDVAHWLSFMFASHPACRLLDLILITENGAQVSMYDKLVVQTQDIFAGARGSCSNSHGRPYTRSK